MKQFKRINIFFYPNQRRVKCQGMFNEFFDLRVTQIFFKKCPNHLITDLTKGFSWQFIEELPGKSGNINRHVQTLVRRKSLDHSFLETDNVVWIVGAVEMHGEKVVKYWKI